MVYRSLFCIVYLAPYFPTVIAFVWNHNALKLLVLFFFFSFFFSFFCQPCLRLRNCKSVFLILKISEYGGLRLWVQLFPRYPCKNWYKNWHLHFYKTYDHQFGRQIHLEQKELTQMRLIKQVLVKSSRQDYVTNLKQYTPTTRVP